jgi:hypothetical protein
MPISAKTIILGCVTGTLILTGGVNQVRAGERIIYDYKGKAHKIPDINYKPPAKSTGIIPKIFSTHRPLQMISPFAARSYGYGRDMVTWDSSEGKPKGFIAAGVRFW